MTEAVPALFPTTLVGSMPQPDWLIDRQKLAGRFPPRVRARELWRIPPEHLQEAQDDATILAIRAQEEAGLDIVTDGEIRRESYSNLFANALEGVDLDSPGTALDRSGHPVPVPRVTGPIRRRHAVGVRDLEFLRQHTTKPVKVTVPGPFTMSQQAQIDHYGGSRHLASADYAVALNAEIRDLFSAGADIVQIDEPYMQARPEEARQYGLEALNRALEGVKGTTAVHICFGYAAIIHARSSAYSFLPELAGCHCQQVSLESAQPNLDCSILKTLNGKKIMLGVLDLGNPEVETAEAVAARIRRALPFVRAENIVVAPDCGLKYLDRDVASGKLKAMVAGAAILRSEMRGRSAPSGSNRTLNVETDMLTSKRTCLSTAVTGILAAAVALPAMAQGTEMEEVIVTARKRDEALLDVPVTVSAFNAQEISSAGIERPQDFIALTPNMTMVQTQNQGTSFIVVRGISQARNSEPSVAVVIDGVAMANPSQFNQELFDVESIEVLKGPQGALYGRNAIGGAVIIRTREPGDEMEGSITAGYDSGPGYKARFGVGGPIGGSDTWKFQLSGSYLDTDGYINNPFLGEEADPFQDVSGRLKLVYEPSDSFRADLRVYMSQVDTQALYFNITEQVDDTSLPVQVNNRGENERDLEGVSLKLDFGLGGGTLTSVTAYDTLEELLTGDQFDFLPIPQSVWTLFNIPTGDQAQHQWLDVEAVSQEIRFTSPAEDRLRWILGAYVIQTDRFISTGNVRDIGDGIVPAVKRTPLPPWLGPGSDERQLSFLADSQDNLAWAAFGELSYDLTDRVEGSVALRYDEDTRENTTETPQGFIPAPINCDLVPPGTPCASTGQVREETWDELQPKVTLRFKPNDDVSTYFSYSRGFRSGGFNQTGVGSTGIPGISDLFDEETADTYEIGVKARFADGRIGTSASVYHTKAEGSYFFVFDPNTSTQNLGNLDEVEYQGFELEFQAQATDNIDFYARGGYTDSEIKESARSPDDVGNQAPLVSEYTVNLGANFRFPFGGSYEFFIRPDFRIIGDTWWYPDNFTKRDPVNILDLRAGVNADRWSAVAWSRNLTDEEYNAEWSPGPQGFPGLGYVNNFVFKAQPQVWGVDFTYRF